MWGRNFLRTISRRRRMVIILLRMVIILLALSQIYFSLFVRTSLKVELKIDWFRVKPTFEESQIWRLPNLEAIDWPQPLVSDFPAGIERKKGESKYLPAPFEPAMSIGQLRLYRRLLKVFSGVMFTNGLGDRFMLTAGTLAGSYHHHDFIPWDDEVDILVDVEVREKVQSLLKLLEPEYLLHVGRSRDKFFARETNATEYTAEMELSKKVPRYRWNWPFVDLPYYRLNKTHVAEVNPSYVREISWPKDIVFPLFFRPFGPVWFPAPKNPLAFLRTRYGKGNTCRTVGYSHVVESSKSSGVARCELLAKRYPFVVHGTCGKFGVTAEDNIMLLNEERLSMNAGYPNSTVIHRLCLAAAQENAWASSFYFQKVTR